MKQNSILINVIVSSIFFAGCYKKYDRTIAVCDNKLFVEVYKHKSIDVGYEYLTDSSNFRIYVGKFDNEHGGYSFICKSDSIDIYERYEGVIINVRKYSLLDLQKGKEGF